jgi:hypothetical protein
MVGTGRFELPKARLRLAPLAGQMAASRCGAKQSWGASRIGSSFVPSRCCVGMIECRNGRDGQI